jgi:hypothetical protein
MKEKPSKLTGFSKDKFLFDPFSVVERVSRFARKFEIFFSSRSISNKLVFGFVVESVGAASKRRSAKCHVEDLSCFQISFIKQGIKVS